MRPRPIAFLSHLLQQTKCNQIKCYLYLLIWIVLFSLVLYWYLITNSIFSSLPTSKASQDGSFKIMDYDTDLDKSATLDLESAVSDTLRLRTLSVQLQRQLNEQHSSETIDLNNNYYATKQFYSTPERICNSPERIKATDENAQSLDYKLYAIIILIRHGDRGPLTHVGHHNISNINCQGKSSFDPDLNSDLKSLLKFSESLSKQPGYIQFIGPFHSFPKIPTSQACHLGQLTQLGAMQLVQLGRILRQTYHSALFTDLQLRTSVSTTHPKITSYSTRYRRTLQSLISFLYGLLGPKFIVPNVGIRESQSISFCFNDCSCKLVERLKKMPIKRDPGSPESKRERTTLINKLSSILGTANDKVTHASLMDLLLVYYCHNTSLPCYPSSPFNSIEDSVECITPEDVSKLISLIQRDSAAITTKSFTNRHQYALLSAYGLLKEILNLALKMSTVTADNQRKSSRLAIFSGHDITLQSILGALGIFSSHPDIHLPPYASRFIFEFYTKVRNISPAESMRRYHFRAVYNGIAVTHLISFCRPNYVQSHGSPADFFCPLENLVRFLHDHYFEPFGNTTTNFRDACQVFN